MPRIRNKSFAAGLRKLPREMLKIVLKAVFLAGRIVVKEALKILRKKAGRLKALTGRLERALESKRAFKSERYRDHQAAALQKAEIGSDLTTLYLGDIKKDKEYWYINAAYTRAKYIKGKSLWTKYDTKKMKKLYEKEFAKYFTYFVKRAWRRGTVIPIDFNVKF